MPRIDPTLAAMLQQTCDVQLLERDANGDLTVNTTWPDQPCAVEFNRMRVLDKDGEKQLAKAVVFLGPDVAYDYTQDNWRVLIDSPAGSSVDYEVLQFVPVRDKLHGDVHHYELMLR